MHFTLTQAAKATGSSKSTINRALSSGRLSGERQPDGSYRIDAAELFRVFPAKPTGTGVPTTVVTGLEPSSGTASEPPERVEPRGDALLQLELRMVRDQLERERQDRERDRSTYQDTIEDLRKRLDQEQEERRALQRQLSPPTPPAPQMAQEVQGRASGAVEPPKPSRGFLARLLGR